MRLTIGRKLGFSFAAVFGLSALVCCFSYIKLSTLSKVQDYTSTVQLDLYTTAYDVRVANQQAGALLGEYLMLSGEGAESDKIKQEWIQTWERLDNNASKLQSMQYKRAENRERTQHLAGLFPEYRRIQQRVMDLASRGGEGKKEAAELFKSQEVPQAAEVRKIASEMVKSVGEVMHAADAEVDAAADQTRWTLILGTLLSILCGSVLLTLVSRRIVKDLEAVGKRANAIAAGDLNGKPIESKSVASPSLPMKYANSPNAPRPQPKRSRR